MARIALIAALVAFVGVILFSILFVIFYFKDKSLKLPSIGLGICFILVMVVGALAHFELGPFNNPITIDNSSIELKVGESTQIDVTADSAPITYKSADTSIATVSDSGTVKAINAGSTTITVTDAKGHTAECTVNASHVQPTAIEFAQADLIVAPSQTVSLEAVFTPENTSDRALDYSIDQNKHCHGRQQRHRHRDF